MVITCVPDQQSQLCKAKEQSGFWVFVSKARSPGRKKHPALVVTIGRVFDLYVASLVETLVLTSDTSEQNQYLHFLQP